MIRSRYIIIFNFFTHRHTTKIKLQAERLNRIVFVLLWQVLTLKASKKVWIFFILVFKKVQNVYFFKQLLNLHEYILIIWLFCTALFIIRFSLSWSTPRRERQGATGSGPNANANAAAAHHDPEDALWWGQQNLGPLANECA